MSISIHAAKVVKLSSAGLLSCLSFSATALNWTKCADEGKDCSIPSNQSVIIRYGSPSYAYFYYSMSGVPKFNCSNFNGDPMVGKSGKVCSYTTAADLHFSDTAITTGSSVAENGTAVWTKELRWMHYGLPKSTLNNNKGTWWNTIQAENWKCNNDALNYDPTPGQGSKKCYKGGLPVPVEVSSDNIPLWMNCGAEKSDCIIDADDVGKPIVLRYGKQSNWTYRIATLGKANISCQTKTFNEDPIKENKECSYVRILPTSGVTTAKWQKIVDMPCSVNAPCANTAYYDLGTNYMSAQEDPSWWAEIVEASVKNTGIAGIGFSINYAAANAYVNSADYQNWLSQTVKVTNGHLSCVTAGKNYDLEVYQFLTQTSITCLRDDVCDHTTKTKNLWCVTDPPADYSGPQCLPGYCDASDPLCEKCTYN